MAAVCHALTKGKRLVRWPSELKGGVAEQIPPALRSVSGVMIEEVVDQSWSSLACGCRTD
jgi:hypothetical protein